MARSADRTRNAVRSAFALGAALLALQQVAAAADRNSPAGGPARATPIADKPSPETVRAMEELLGKVAQPAGISSAQANGVVSWKTLAQVSVVKQNDKFAPEFSRDLAALDRRQVKLQGFMLPLDVGEKQKRFLLTATPPSCAFCLPGGPEQMVEVQARTAIKHGYEPIVISGRLSLVRDDPAGVLYRLTEAAIVER